ncbi:MAG: Asp-tRNA(Asn)/Glu-tRNA(Gln) amidotransferase subunit GatC [Alkalispirochaeta sp.]
MDPSELKTTVDMAMLEIDESHITALEGAVRQMLEYFTTMSFIDVENVEPTTHAFVTGNRVRPDRLNRTVEADTLLENAPDLEDRLIAIPNVL